MGTRSLTHVKGDVWDVEKEAPTILTFYRQYDGYPTGHGVDLKRFLDGRVIVNGISSDAPAKISNGMGCLAASLVGKLKGDEVGGIYVYAPDSTDCGEEWVYTIYQKGTRNAASELHIKVYAVYRERTVYDGPVSGFDPEAAEKAAYGDEDDEDEPGIEALEPYTVDLVVKVEVRATNPDEAKQIAAENAANGAYAASFANEAEAVSAEALPG